MNEVHFHLLTNHFPIIVPIIAFLVLIGGFIFRSDMVKKTALALFVFAAVSTFVAMATGDKAEHFAEKIPGISHDIIHEHEEIAETFALLNYILGAVSLAGIWALWKNHRFANLLTYAVFILALVSFWFANQTGTTGGEIRHTEIRGDFVPAPPDRDDD